MFEEKIQEFSKFNDNWNGNYAKQISNKVINNALLLDKYLYVEDNCKPEIFPTFCNSIQIEYEKDNHYLEIEIKEDCFEIFQIKNNKEYYQTVALNEMFEVINLIKLFYQPCVKNLCLFTGAFNPCTIAHYHMIDSAMNTKRFDYIVFAISNQKFLDKKQKRLKDFAYSEQQRLEMILAMTYKCPNVLIFGVEQGYTYEVLKATKEKYQCDSLYFALGSDKLQEINRWGFHDKLLIEFCFYILQRKDSLTEIQRKCQDLFFKTDYIIGKDNETYKDISATSVRNKIKNNQDFKDLVVEEVYQLLLCYNNT